MDLQKYESAYPARHLSEGAQVTRIGPSPTGKAHIGTAMQAVINRALATGSGGRFLLRVEDTDRERFVEGAYEDLVANLAWLGVLPDEGPTAGGDYGPYVQSERLAIYQAAARHLVESGHAYYCFCTPERLEAVRRTQEAQKKPTMYDRHCRNLPLAEAERRIAAGERVVVRLKVPDGVEISFDDLVRGPIAFDSATVDDSVILKSDGFPTYHLAVVVDDHFMRVTLTVRGEEWIPSTPKHVLLYRAFGWPMPRFAHTPILRDMKRRKLSKRSGDTSMTWYRIQGYLPEGLRNFLTRIIWVHPENKDVYDHADFVHGFQAEALPVTGPIVDLQLLDFINGQYLRRHAPEELYLLMVEYLKFLLELDPETLFWAFEAAPPPPEERVLPAGQPQSLVASVRDFLTAFSADPAYSQRVLSLEPERFRRLRDILASTTYYFAPLFGPVEPQLLGKPLGDLQKARALLSEYLGLYSGDDDHTAWEQKVRTLARSAGVKDGKLFMTLRIALTGSEQTPPLFEIIEILGPAEVRRRLQLAVA